MDPQSLLTQHYTETIYGAIIDLSPMPVFVCAGEDMVVVVANQATLKAWGKDKSVIGKKFKDAIPEMENQPFLDLLRQVYYTGITYYTEQDRADFVVDGKLRSFYFKFSYQPLRNDEGKTWAVLCIATDVTDLVLANRRAEESEKRFRSLILKAPVALCVLRGPQFIVEVANERVLQIWGVTERQVVNKPIFEGLPEAKGQGIEELLSGVYYSGKTFVAEEMRVDLPTADGVQKKVLNFVYEPYYEVDGTITGVMAAAIDVTEQVQGRMNVEEANRQLEETRQRLELALQAGELGAYERDMQTGEILASPQFKMNIGFPADATVRLRDIMDAILPEYKEKVEEVQNKCLYDDCIYNVEFPLTWPDGSIHWLRVVGRSLNNQHGRRLMSGVSQDITEQKLVQQQKDDFISIASHELKTPITTLKASLQILNRLKSDPESPMLPHLIVQANNSLTKVSNLIDDLLNASRMKEGQLELKPSRFLIAQAIDECCQHVRALGTYQIVSSGDLDVEVYADEHRIDQVLVNLINNAVKYAPESRIIRVSVERLEGKVKISVSDEGPGIPRDKVPHLFDRYYRVNEGSEMYSGLGLGLYISAEIIKRHKGEIGAESELGKGSTFWFTIPLS